MTDPTSSETAPPQKKCPKGRGLFAVILMGLGLMLIASGSLMQVEMQKLDEEVANDRTRIRALEDQLKDLQSGTASAPAAAAAPPAAITGQNAAVTHMQADLASLSTALTALQGEVKATGTATAQSKVQTRNSIASILAFLELRDAVFAGRKFGGELNAMKTAAKGNDALETALEKLAPYADTGVATPAALAEQLIPLEAGAQAVIDHNAAKGWSDRILAELKGLISIHSLHGGSGADFTAMETSLDAGDVNGALAALQNLPPGAQHALDGWRTHAEARAAAESALHDVTGVLGAEGTP